MDAEPSVNVRCSSFPGSSLGATASDGCQEGCEEGREEGREEVSAGAWGSISQIVVIECSCMDVGHFFRDVRDTSCIASLEIGGLRDPLWTSRLTSSGLAQGCEEDREEDEGAEDEGEARDLGAISAAASNRRGLLGWCSERLILRMRSQSFVLLAAVPQILGLGR